jgi:hypothetical protein
MIPAEYHRMLDSASTYAVAYSVLISPQNNPLKRAIGEDNQMMRYLFFACLFPVVLLASATQPENSNLTASGNDFLRVCGHRSDPATSIDGFCSGYANGVIDGYDYAFAFLQAERHERVIGAFCPPDVYAGPPRANAQGGECADSAGAGFRFPLFAGEGTDQMTFAVIGI